MEHRKTWALALGVIALVLAGFWALPQVVPDQEWGLGELNQVAGIASLAVAVATLIVALWPTRPVGPGDYSGNRGRDKGDSINLSRIKAEGSVKAKSGPRSGQDGDRIRMRGIRAGKDVIGKQTTQPRKRPHR
ncbi:hypothetical protein [Nocardiopsis dassonvillei]|uniref:hypothetical protein n=1 Tax=Nocardiopsis dassonvillei TaxID=2014 RepID=UPI00367210E4